MFQNNKHGTSSKSIIYYGCLTSRKVKKNPVFHNGKSIKHASLGNGDIWISFFSQAYIVTEQNGLDLASVLEIFLPMHASSQNACAHFCVFVGGKKLARKVFKATSAFFVLLLLYKRPK